MEDSLYRRLGSFELARYWLLRVWKLRVLRFGYVVANFGVRGGGWGVYRRYLSLDGWENCY